MKINIINLGRNRYNGSIDVEEGHSDWEIVGRICTESRKHLRSDNIEVYFDKPNGGSIVAGWRPVGAFEIIKESE